MGLNIEAYVGPSDKQVAISLDGNVDSVGHDPTGLADAKSLSRREFIKAASLSAGATFLTVEFPSLLGVLRPPDYGYEVGVGEAAQGFVARTYPEAVRVSESLLGKGADPSNICGPLSFAIALGRERNFDYSFHQGPVRSLEGVIPKEMWLSSPDGASTDPRLLASAFPPETTTLFRDTQSIGLRDFDNIPGAGKLYPGDVLYLKGGSFTHWVTVSRQGADGKLYATTNMPTPKKGEFIIDEVVLWDPLTKDGYLRNWAKGVGPENAYTGREGFFLWRRNKECEQMLMGPTEQKYRDWFTNRLEDQTKGQWNIQISEIGKGQLFEWRNGMVYHPASTIKVPVGVSMMRVLNEQFGFEIANSGLESVINAKGFDGRTFHQLMTAMLVKSEEAATESCVGYIRKNSTMEEQFKHLGLTQSMFSPRRSTQRDLYSCWNKLFTFQAVDPVATKYLLSLLSTYTVNDDIMLGAVKRKIPCVSQWNKRGEVMGDGLFTMQDTGVLGIGSRFFYLGLSGTSSERYRATDVELVSFIEELCEKFADYAIESTTL